MRIGQGVDVHPFSEDPHRPLVLGGVAIEGARGLRGHSDADAVCHAVADAVLGAIGLGDLGQHFPDTDDAWAGANSMALLGEVLGAPASVKATRAEGIGALGRAEGIACLAVVLMDEVGGPS